MQEISIKVLGLASQRIYGPFFIDDLNQKLLDFLTANSITIASSCSGEGVCKKCVIQDEVLTCQITLKEFLEKYPDKIVKVSYL